MRKNGNWTDEQLKAAIAAHDEGMNMKKASDTFNIPYLSFKEHCYGLRISWLRKAKGVLTLEEERQLVQWLIQMAKVGHGLSITTLKMKVSEITMARAIPFRNGILGGGVGCRDGDASI